MRIDRYRGQFLISEQEGPIFWEKNGEMHQSSEWMTLMTYLQVVESSWWRYCAAARVGPSSVQQTRFIFFLSILIYANIRIESTKFWILNDQILSVLLNFQTYLPLLPFGHQLHQSKCMASCQFASIWLRLEPVLSRSEVARPKLLTFLTVLGKDAACRPSGSSSWSTDPLWFKYYLIWWNKWHLNNFQIKNLPGEESHSNR